MRAILKLKENEYFEDPIASQFQKDYAENLALRTTVSAAKKKLFPKMNKLKITQNTLEHLMHLTNVNPFDAQEMMDYQNYLNDLENKHSEVQKHI